MEIGARVRELLSQAGSLLQAAADRFPEECSHNMLEVYLGLRRLQQRFPQAAFQDNYWMLPGQPKEVLAENLSVYYQNGTRKVCIADLSPDSFVTYPGSLNQLSAAEREEVQFLLVALISYGHR